MNDCAVALGSNRGDRAAHLRWALRMLSRLSAVKLMRTSSFFESAPVGGPRQKPYLNAAAWLRTRRTPMGLLIEFKRLEYLRGRRPGPLWGPRPLDIDLLFYTRRRVNSRWLRVPHPRALTRPFVLEPLAQLSPDWSPPVQPRRSVRCWRRLTASTEKVQWIRPWPAKLRRAV